MAIINVNEAVQLPKPGSTPAEMVLLRTLSDILRKHAYAINQLIGDVNTLTTAAPPAPGSGPPTEGAYNQGDFIWNAAPEILGNVGSYYVAIGWSNVAGGSPGTWLPVYVFIDATGSGAPSTGTAAAGAVSWNTTPAITGATGQQYVTLGWMCTVAGTPGTWVGLRPMLDVSPGDAPSTGAWEVGNFYWNATPAETGNAGAKYITLGWSCVTAGTPGTWVGVRVFTGN